MPRPSPVSTGAWLYSFQRGARRVRSKDSCSAPSDLEIGQNTGHSTCIDNPDTAIIHIATFSIVQKCKVQSVALHLPYTYLFTQVQVSRFMSLTTRLTNVPYTYLYFYMEIPCLCTRIFSILGLQDAGHLQLKVTCIWQFRIMLNVVPNLK